MKPIGLLGGMSWESTAVYYRHLNERMRDLRGGLASAELVVRSFDFARIVALQKKGAWDEAGQTLAEAACGLEAAGAKVIIICTNTMHLLADQVASATTIPLLHIVDATAEKIVAAGYGRPLLLATRYTMEQDFYKGRLKQKYGLDALVPDEADRTIVHDVIFDEICQGIISPQSQATYQRIIEKGAAQGADCVILGCTEIGLLIGNLPTAVPPFDSTLLHADAAFDFALADQAA